MIGLPKPYYDHAGITIYHADCRDILPYLEPVDLVLTDMPYGAVNRQSNGLRNLDKRNADIVGFDLHEVIKEIHSVCSGCFYIFCGTEQVSMIRNYFVFNGCTTRLGVWEKTNPSPMNGEYIWLSSIEVFVYAKNKKGTHNVFCESPVFKIPIVKNQLHPTEKPQVLFAKLISASSNLNHLVLDPFMGSGTTLVAAKELGRKAIGIEIEEKYCAIAVDRLRQEVLPFKE